MFSHRQQGSGKKPVSEKRKRESSAGKRPRSKPSLEPDNKRYSPFLLDDTQDVIWEENQDLEGLSCTQTSVTDGPAAVTNKENTAAAAAASAKSQKKRKWKGRLTKRALRPVNRGSDEQAPSEVDEAAHERAGDANKPEEIIQLLENIASKFNQPSATTADAEGTGTPVAQRLQDQLEQHEKTQVVEVNAASTVVTPAAATSLAGTNHGCAVPTTQPSYAVEDVSLEELAELDEIEKFAYTQAAVHSQQPQQLSAGYGSQRSVCSTSSMNRPHQSQQQRPVPQSSSAVLKRSQSAASIVRSQSEPGKKQPLSRLQGALQCYRFVALEIGEGSGVRCKNVLCTLVDSNVPESAAAQSSSRTWTVRLHDEWYFTPLCTGDTFHVVGLGKEDGSGLFTQLVLQQPNAERELHVSNSRGMLVLHPDVLISPTKVADACNCDRKGALSERLKTFGNLSRPAALGNVKHTFAEHVIRAFNDSVLRDPQRRPTPPNQQIINDFVKQSRAAHVVELFAVDANDAQIDAELRGMIGPLWHWLHGTIGQQSGVRRSQTVPARNRAPPTSSALQLSHIVGTEENIWSPVFGLKGQIDVTAVTNSAALNGVAQVGLSPLELKTGKRRDYVLIPHKAQVMLYLLLLQTRVQHTQYARVGKEGFLVYLSSDGVVCDNVLPVWDELRSLMIARNRCALSALGPTSGPLRYDSPIGLPPVIRQPNDCQRCYQAAECMLYHAAVENGTPQSSGVPDLFQQIVHALKPEHLSYFRHWDRLIELESSTGASSRPQLWTLDGVQREKTTGKCIGGLICDGIGQDLVTGESLVTLKRQTAGSEQNQLPLKELPFAAGDRVIVSLDGHRSVSMSSDGLVDLEDCRVSAAGQPLGYGVHLFVANVACIDDSSIQLRLADLPDFMPHWVAGPGGRGPKLRVDKDELSTGIATMRSNLAQMLIEPHQPQRYGPSAASNVQQLPSPEDARLVGGPKLRSLVVELQLPRFEHVGNTVAGWFATPPAEVPHQLGPNGEQYRLGYPTVYPGCAPQQLVHEIQALNPDQRAAIHKVLSAQDYALLLGMPGTGKTYTIACLVRTLVARGATVLLSSYTHSAVDNMLQKLADAGVTPGMALRIGSKQQTPQQLHPYLLENQGVDSIARLTEVVESSRVVAVTCLGVRHAIFTKKRFDVCILDEAGQAPQPAALGPLLSANKFVLVGDHYQLPPLVSNPEALAHGMDISLFRRLCEAHPSAVQYLSFQYRMNADIMQLSNTLVYGQQLRCANSAVAKGRLQLKHLPLLMQRCGVTPTPSPANVPQDWLVRVLHPSNGVVFMDTDTISLSQRARLSGTQEVTPEGQHAVEAKLTELCVRALLACGAQPSDVGVITPFRNQQRAFRRTITERYAVEVSTIDKFQGRDVKALVVSFGSTSKGSVGDLLRDWRRINVAITRARFKLIMLGSRTMAQSSPVMAELLETVYRNQWNVGMPEQLARYEAIVTQVVNATRA